MKKTLLWNLLCVFFSILLVLETFGAKETIQESAMPQKDSYNVMLLIDKSGSMNNTDKKRMALNAASQFVEQLCTYHGELSMVTNVGVMSFSQDTEVISQPISLDSETNTNYLKSKINLIEYDKENTGGTDLGTAIYEAAQILKKNSSENQKSIIVLFTDGYSESVQDEELSEQNREEALRIAQELSCEIYIVGLNQDNRIKDKGRKEIYSIADKTQTGDGVAEAEKDDSYAQKKRVNYLITDNFKDVRVFYGKIYANMINAYIHYLDDHEFRILTDSILETDVIIGSDEPIDSISIMDPDNNILEEDGKTFFVSGDSYYKVVRILKPKKGIWTVYVETKDKSYITYAIDIYGIEPVLTPSWGRKEEKDYQDSGLEEPLIGKAEVALMYKSELYQEDDLLEELTQTEVAVTDLETGKELGVYPLSYSSSAGKYIGYFPVEENKSYELVATLQDADGTLNITAKGELPNILLDAEPTTPETTVPETTTPDDSPISDTVIPDKPDSVHAVLTVICFLLLFFLGGAVLAKALLTHVSGSFEVLIEIDSASDSGYRGESIERELESYPYGKAFSLWKLIEKIISECQSSDNETEKGICNMLLKEKAQISKKKLVVCKLNSKKNMSRKVYKLQDNNQYFYDLTVFRTCYQSQELSIKLTFKGIDADDETEDNFANLSDIPNTPSQKRRGIGKGRL